MSVDVVTFGCRLNAAESEVIRREAAAAGVREAVVVNTCAVTGEAVKQARQTVRKLRRERPDARIVVTGCAAQTEPHVFAAMPEVDRVLGNEEKLSGAIWSALDAAPRVSVGDIMAVRSAALHRVDGIEGHTRAFLQVQNGCDHRCTFCIIPFGRGNSRSVPVDDVVAQARLLVERGHREIVLTGVDITSYAPDAERPGLGLLVKRLLRDVPELERLRLSSIDSVEADDDLRVRPLPLELADRLPRLPHGLAGHRATVDDNGITAEA
jgi:threonylcarbamoyladenosine tRNA methylthiotransferase MtaB